MDTSHNHFDADDHEILAKLGINLDGDASSTGPDDGDDDAGNASAGNGTDTQQAAGTDAGSSEQGQASAAADGSASGQDGKADDSASQGNAAQDEQQASGNVKAALRASRRAEARLRDKLNAAQAELERLREGLPAGTTDTNGDPDMDALEADYPGIAKVIKAQAQRIEELTKTSSAQGEQPGGRADPEFTPPALPTEVQEVVDEIPALLDMQHNPDQTGWQLAVKYDAALRNDPDWEGATAQERFAEAARRATDKLGQSTRQPSAPAQGTQQAASNPRQAAAAKAAQATTRTPESLSDFGGAATEPQGSNLARYARMSEQDIVNELLRGG